MRTSCSGPNKGCVGVLRDHESGVKTGFCHEESGSPRCPSMSWATRRSRCCQVRQGLHPCSRIRVRSVLRRVTTAKYEVFIGNTVGLSVTELISVWSTSVTWCIASFTARELAECIGRSKGILHVLFLTGDDFAAIRESCGIFRRSRSVRDEDAHAIKRCEEWLDTSVVCLKAHCDRRGRSSLPDAMRR